MSDASLVALVRSAIAQHRACQPHIPLTGVEVSPLALRRIGAQEVAGVNVLSAWWICDVERFYLRLGRAGAGS